MIFSVLEAPLGSSAFASARELPERAVEINTLFSVCYKESYLSSRGIHDLFNAYYGFECKSFKMVLSQNSDDDGSS